MELKIFAHVLRFLCQLSSLLRFPFNTAWFLVVRFHCFFIKARLSHHQYSPSLSFSDLFVFAEALGKLHFGHVYGKSLNTIGVRREHTIGVSLHFQPCPSEILPEGPPPPWGMSLFFLHSSLLCCDFHAFIIL